MFAALFDINRVRPLASPRTPSFRPTGPVHPKRSIRQELVYDVGIVIGSPSQFRIQRRQDNDLHQAEFFWALKARIRISNKLFSFRSAALVGYFPPCHHLLLIMIKTPKEGEAVVVTSGHAVFFHQGLLAVNCGTSFA
jgi:hypothetical protein